MRTRLVSVLALLLCAPAAFAQVVRQVTDELTVAAGPGALDDAGSAVYTGSSSDPAGTNPRHAFQVVRYDPLTGVPTVITSAPGGTALLVSVSDDGQWLAFPSPSDLTGGNHDRSIELFAMRSDGTELVQLTSDPAPNAGSVGEAVLSGNGSRVAFLANTDPLGTNPTHRQQLFVVDRAGTGLRQLTFAASGSIGGISLSDDGTRIAFSHTADLTGGNPDLGSEVFAILADGTGLRQLTSTPAPYGSGSPSLSGNGTRIAFGSDGDLVPLNNAAHQEEVFVVDWAGTGLRQLTKTARLLGLLGDPASTSPSITDDGAWVFYSSNHSTLFPPVNLDGNYEIFKIRNDGTGRAALTSSVFALGNLLPTVSGGGGRVTSYGIDTTNVSLEVMDGAGANRRVLLTFSVVFNAQAEVSADGARAAFVRSVGLTGAGELWKVGTDGSDRAPLATFASGGASSPSFSGDGSRIYFAGDLPDGNADGSTEIYAIGWDGTGLVPLTAGAAETSCGAPVAARDAGTVFFQCDGDLTGGNPDLSTEIFRVGPDGQGVFQVTSGIAGTASGAPRPDAAGTWVVFASDADLDGGNADGSREVWRVRADGSGLERLTAGAAGIDSGSPDISADGTRIVWASPTDPLGANPEGNSEIFAWDAATGTVRQLTAFAAGGSSSPRIADDGGWVWFSSDAPVFEDDPDRPSDLFRVPFAGGPIQRVSGQAGGISGLPISGGSGSVAIDGAGRTGAFSGLGDFTGGNKDGQPEVWIIDRLTPPAFEVGRPSPTELAWTTESGPIRSDAIRTTRAALALSPGGTVDLGPVTCLEDDSPDSDTAGSGDPAEPSPGELFLYLYRGSQGLADGPGSYGTSSDGRERRPSSGDCPG